MFTPIPDPEEETACHSLRSDQEARVPSTDSHPNNLPGVTRPQGVENKQRRPPGSVMPGQRRKHPPPPPQGRSRRGSTPAPTLLATAQGIVPAATPVGTHLPP